MLKLSLRPNPINREICTLLFTGLALRESLDVVSFYICNMQNTCNSKPSDYHLNPFVLYLCKSEMLGYYVQANSNSLN
jgi:hypothetical protein